MSGEQEPDEDVEIDEDLVDSDRRTDPARCDEIDRDLRLEGLYRSMKPDLVQPRMIGRFEALERIGEGGFGVVYRARDPELGRTVAVKLCPSLRPEAIEVFRREAEILAMFSHPNIVTVFEVGRHGDDFFYAMELIEGCDGARYIQRWTDWRDVLATYEAAASGLAAAHDKGIVHGDFKPANLLIGDDGRVCVADFGLAQLIDDGTDADHPSVSSHRPGTLPYMAPELLAGRPAHARADQWALCVSLWETLYGCRPFVGDTPETLLAAIQSGEPQRGTALMLPRALQGVLRRGLSVDPAKRYPNMRALIQALTDVRAPAPSVDKSLRRGFAWGMLLTGSVVLGVLGGISLRRPTSVEPSLPIEPTCALSESETQQPIDASVVGICKLIRDNDIVAASTLWESLHEDRVPESGDAHEWTRLAVDTLIIARTFVVQAELVAATEPETARVAALTADLWAIRASQCLGKVDIAAGSSTSAEIEQVRERAASVIASLDG